MRQGFSWTQLSVGRVRTGAVRDLFGVGKCHEFDQFGGQLVRAWAGYWVAVGRSSLGQWVTSWGGSATSWGGWLVVWWSVVEWIVRSGSGITPPKV